MEGTVITKPAGNNKCGRKDKTLDETNAHHQRAVKRHESHLSET